MGIFRSYNHHSPDYGELRERMVRSQIEARGVRNHAVLSAMRTVPRHLFVPEKYRSQAYEDHPLPIGNGQTISQPYMVGSMTELLEIDHNSNVLEIGTGSGYQTAVLAEIARDVFTVEVVPSLHEHATAVLMEMRYSNVKALLGDGSKGWPDHAPYDAILVTAAAKNVPKPLIEQLAPGGRMVIPVESRIPDTQQLVKLKRTERGLERQSLYHVRFVPLKQTGE